MINNRKRIFVLRGLVLFFSFAFMISSLCGCEPLRKKFRREKKKTEDLSFVPVLDPVDYPPRGISAQERYAYHYSLWKGWEKELEQSYASNSAGYSEKRQKYLLAEIISQLQEMKSWIVQEKALELDKVIAQFLGLQKEFEKPEDLRSQTKIKSTLRRSSGDIREKFSPDVVQEFLIK